MQDIALPKSKSLRRVCVRCFVALALMVIVIDTAPRWRFLKPLHDLLHPALNAIGLWQGTWPLFAPNPVINNGWMSVDFYANGDASPLLAPDGKPQIWNSPFWSEFDAWDKFYRFRHVNYFNRIPYQMQIAIDDLTDYVARAKLGSDFHYVESDPLVGPNNSPPIELRLSLTRLQIVLPDDGSLPSPEETTWMSVSSILAKRKYSQ